MHVATRSCVLRHRSRNFTRRNVRLRFNGKQKNLLDAPVCLGGGDEQSSLIL